MPHIKIYFQKSFKYHGQMDIIGFWIWLNLGSRLSKAVASFFILKFKYLSGQRLLCLRNFSLIYIKPPVTECDVEILLELCPFLVSFRGQGEQLKVHFVCLLCWELPRLVLFSISHRRMEIRMEFTLPPAYVLPIASLFSFNEIVQCSQCTCKSK